MGLQEAQIEQLNSRKQEILEKCELEHISIPTISDPMDTEETTPGPVFDFSKLSRACQQNNRPSDREKLEAEFSQKIATLMSDIERTAPNLKALDQYEALRQKEDAVTKEFEDAKNEEKKVTDEYNRVKETRYYFISTVLQNVLIHITLKFASLLTHQLFCPSHLGAE